MPNEEQPIRFRRIYYDSESPVTVGYTNASAYSYYSVDASTPPEPVMEKIKYNLSSPNSIEWASGSDIVSSISEKAFEKIAPKLNQTSWRRITRFQKLTDDFVLKYKDKIVMSLISFQYLKEETFIELIPVIDVTLVLRSQGNRLSLKFIEAAKDKLDWSYAIECYNFDEAGLIKYEKYIKTNIYYHCINNDISEYSDEFFKIFMTRINWNQLSDYKNHKKLVERFKP